MTCEEFLRLLDADEGWREGEAAAHAASCASCGAHARRMDAAGAAFAAMREDEAAPFLHTRVMARVREEGAKAPWWKVVLNPRTAWAGPLMILLVAALVGGYGFKQIMAPATARKPVPQSELAKPSEVALGAESRATDSRIQTPPVDLPMLGGAEQGMADKDAPAKENEADIKQKAVVETDDEAAGARGGFAPPPPAAPQPVVVPSVPGAGFASVPETAAEGGVTVADAAPARQAPAPEPSGKGQLMASAEKKAEEVRREASAGELQEMERPKNYILVDLVPCSLRAEGGQEYVLIDLPQVQAPPVGVQWEVTVKRDGVVEVRDETGSWLKEASQSLQLRAPDLNLMPGRYRLGRRP